MQRITREVSPWQDPILSEWIPESTLTIEVDGDYWQLWAKAVTGIDLSQHCMKSLIGPTARGLGRNMPQGQELKVSMPAPAGLICWYVCGVSVYSRLEQNAHLMAVPRAGSTASLEWDWGKASLTNAQRVGVVPDFIDPRDRNAQTPSYCTCRNWQAAWMIRGGQVRRP